MKIFSIKDRASEHFNQPFFQHTAAAAIRIIKNEMRQENSMLAAHPSDFELWELGTFDDQTGQLTNEHTRVARLEDLKEPATPNSQLPAPWQQPSSDY